MFGTRTIERIVVLWSPQRGIFEAYLYRNLRSKNQGYWVIDHAPSKKLDFMVVLTSSDTDCKYLSIGFSAKIQNVFYQHPGTICVQLAVDLCSARDKSIF